MKRIFISYRRDDSAYVAAAINEKLEQRFGNATVFFDVDSIQLGTDFRKSISEAVGKCDVLLAIIGDRWVEAADRQGNRRLDDPADFVRLELESALTRNIPVIPVLIGEARIPSTTVLPSSLQELTFRNAAEVRAGRDLPQHITRLIDGIEVFIQPEARQEKQASPGSSQTSSNASRERIAGHRGLLDKEPFSPAERVTSVPTSSKSKLLKALEIWVALLARGYSLVYLNVFRPALSSIQPPSPSRPTPVNADEQFNLGRMYHIGEGVPKDDAAALNWYRKAADQGYAIAQNNLGWMYHIGEGVPKDDAAALNWLRKAADQGYAIAQNNLEKLLEKNRR